MGKGRRGGHKAPRSKKLLFRNPCLLTIHLALKSNVDLPLTEGSWAHGSFLLQLRMQVSFLMPSTTPLAAPKALVSLRVPSQVLGTALSCHFPFGPCLHMAINSKYISSDLTSYSFLTQGSGLDIQQVARSSHLVKHRAMKAQYTQN